jgi:hypothetical protein
MKLFGRRNSEKPPGKAPADLEDIERPNERPIERPKTGIPEFDDNPELLKLMQQALEEGARQIQTRGWQRPFAVIETPDGQFVQGFTGDRLEMEYEDARKAVLSAPPEATSYALSWAGYLTIDGVRYETVMVQGGQRGKPKAVYMGQRYKQKLPDVKFQPIGNPAVIAPGVNLLTLSLDPDAASKLEPVVIKIRADVDHNSFTAGDKALNYELKPRPGLILEFGDLDLPFRKEFQKKPDTVHVLLKGMRGRIWATVFKPEDKEVYLNRDSLVPLQGGQPFPGFRDDGMIIIGYIPPVPKSDDVKDLVMPMFWGAMFKVTDKETK